MMELHYNYYQPHERTVVMTTSLQDNQSISTKSPLWPPSSRSHQMLDRTTSVTEQNAWLRRSMLARNREITNQYTSPPNRDVSQIQMQIHTPKQIERGTINTSTSQCLRSTACLSRPKDNPLLKTVEIAGQPLEVVKYGYYKEFLAESLLKKSVPKTNNHKKQSHKCREALHEEGGPASKKTKPMDDKRDSNSNHEKYPESAFRVFSRKDNCSHLDVIKEGKKNLPPPPPLVKVDKVKSVPSPGYSQDVSRSLDNHHHTMAVQGASRLQSIKNSPRPLDYPHVTTPMSTSRPRNTPGSRDTVNTPRHLEYQQKAMTTMTWMGTSMLGKTPRPQEIWGIPGSMANNSTMSTINTSKLGNTPKPQEIWVTPRPVDKQTRINTSKLGNVPKPQELWGTPRTMDKHTTRSTINTSKLGNAPKPQEMWVTPIPVDKQTRINTSKLGNAPKLQELWGTPRTMDKHTTRYTISTSKLGNAPKPQEMWGTPRPVDKQTRMSIPELGNAPKLQQLWGTSGSIANNMAMSKMSTSKLGNIPRPQESRNKPRLMDNGHTPRFQNIHDTTRSIQDTSGCPDAPKSCSAKETTPRHDIIEIRDSPPSFTIHHQENKLYCPNRVISRSFSFESEKTLQLYNSQASYNSSGHKDHHINRYSNTKIHPMHTCRCQCKNCQTCHSPGRPPISFPLLPSSKPLKPMTSPPNSSSYKAASVPGSKSRKRHRFLSCDDASILHSSGPSKSLHSENHHLDSERAYVNRDNASLKVQETENHSSSFLRHSQLEFRQLLAQPPSTKGPDSPTPPQLPPSLLHQSQVADNINKSCEMKKSPAPLSSSPAAPQRCSPDTRSNGENRNENTSVPPIRAYSLGDEDKNQSCTSQLPTEIPEIEEDKDFKPYGGYAFDHDSLPIIVAVHSICVGNQNYIEDPKLNSTSDASYDPPLDNCSSSVLSSNISTAACYNVSASPNVSSTSQEVPPKCLTVKETTSNAAVALSHSMTDVTEDGLSRAGMSFTSSEIQTNNSENIITSATAVKDDLDCTELKSGCTKDNSTSIQVSEFLETSDTTCRLNLKKISASLTCQVKPYIVVKGENQQGTTFTRVTVEPSQDFKEESQKPLQDIVKQATEEAGINVIQVADEEAGSNPISIPGKMKKESTVQSLSEKILHTRKRIEKEDIDWKKKLLCRLEFVLTKKLRKAETTTGEKSTIQFPSDAVKDKPKTLNKTHSTSDKNQHSEETEKCDGEKNGSKISRKKKKDHKLKKIFRIRMTTDEDILSDYELTIEEAQESQELVL